MWKVSATNILMRIFMKKTIFNKLLIILAALFCQPVYSQTAEEFFYRGIDNMGWGNYIVALRDFNRALQLDTAFADAYHMRGDVKSQLGDFNGAVRDFTRALEYKDFDANIYYDRALNYVNLRQFNEAFDDFNQSIILDPTSYRTFYARAVLRHYILEDYKGAIEDYTETVNINARDASAFYNRGLAKFNLGQYIEAKENIRKAYELIPLNYEYFFSYKNLGFYLDSIAYIDSLLATNPSNAEILGKRGELNMSMGLYNKAINDLNEALKVAAGNANLYFIRGKVFTMQGNFTSATRDFSTAISLDSKNAYYFYRRATLKHYFPRDYDGAVQDYTKALEIDRNNPRFLLGRAKANIQRRGQKEHEQSIDDLRRIIIIYPDNVAALEELGDLYVLLREFEEAIKVYSDAIEISPRSAILYYKRGMAKHRIDRIADACLDLSYAGELGYVEVYLKINDYCNR